MTETKQEIQVAKPKTLSEQALSIRISDRYAVTPDVLIQTLQKTAFRQKEGKELTATQLVACMIVADQYHLNPFTKEIYAFEKAGVITPIVSIDGWVRLVQACKDYDGHEFVYGPEEPFAPLDGKKLPAWIEVKFYHKTKTHPSVTREYLSEVYVPARGQFVGPWQTHTRRFHRHKAYIQGARIAYGLSGIYDEDEAMRINADQAVSRRLVPDGQEPPQTGILPVEMAEPDPIPDAVVEPETPTEQPPAQPPALNNEELEEDAIMGLIREANSPLELTAPRNLVKSKLTRKAAVARCIEAIDKKEAEINHRGRK